MDKLIFDTTWNQCGILARHYGITAKRIGWLLVVLIFAFGSCLAQAKGVDTSEKSLNSLNTWLTKWIPLLCTAGVIVLSILWWFHVVRADAGLRGVIAMIICGSAAFLVGLFLT